MGVKWAQTLGGIYRVGVKFTFLRFFFQIFWSHNGQKWLVFQFKRSNSYLNGQILIQTDSSGAIASIPPTDSNTDSSARPTGW
jgi:hypothetical protein